MLIVVSPFYLTGRSADILIPEISTLADNGNVYMPLRLRTTTVPPAREIPSQTTTQPATTTTTPTTPTTPTTSPTTPTTITTTKKPTSITDISSTVKQTDEKTKPMSNFSKDLVSYDEDARPPASPEEVATVSAVHETKDDDKSLTYVIAGSVAGGVAVAAAVAITLGVLSSQGKLAPAGFAPVETAV